MHQALDTCNCGVTGRCTTVAVTAESRVRSPCHGIKSPDFISNPHQDTVFDHPAPRHSLHALPRCDIIAHFLVQCVLSVYVVMILQPMQGTCRWRGALFLTLKRQWCCLYFLNVSRAWDWCVVATVYLCVYAHIQTRRTWGTQM